MLSPSAWDYLLADLPFAVVDVETTTVGRTSRILEVAIVRVNSHGHVLGEYDTLVKPGIPITTEWVHGIGEADVADAPTFDQVAQTIAYHLSGAVIVAHNAGFDMRMLAIEMARLGIDWQAPHVCTMVLRKMAGLPGPRQHKLSWACWQQAQPLVNAHRALHDTRATAGLTVAYLQKAVADGKTTLGELAVSDDGFSPTWKLPLLAVKDKPDSPRKVRAEDIGPAPVWNQAASEEEALRSYGVLLGHHINQNEVTELHVETLHNVVTDLKLTSEQVQTAHADLVRKRVRQAMDDGHISEEEFAVLNKFTSKLAVSHRVLAQAMRSSLSPALAAKMPGTGYAISFAGRVKGDDGKTVSSDTLKEMARELGFYVKPAVTHDVHVVVADDIKAATGKVAKARNYGIRLMRSDEFFALVAKYA